MSGYKSKRTRQNMEASIKWWKECKLKGINIWETKLQSSEG